MRCRSRARIKIVLAVFVACLFVCGESSKGDFRFGEPAKVSEINSSSIDHYPQISRDGLELYFTSNRPYDADRCYNDIWVAKRSSTKEAWGTPAKINAPINSNRTECCPCVSADGLELYFTDGVTALYGACGQNPSGYGGSDLWVSARASREDPWGEPRNLGDMINTSSDDDLPSISVDGLSLYFASDRPGGYGNFDIYVSTRPTKADPWGYPVNLGPAINTWQFEVTPYIAPDDLTLYFAMGTWWSDIYVSRRDTTTSPWRVPVPLDPVNLSDKAEYNLSFSTGDSAVYFTRGDDVTAVASYDIWQIEVHPVVDFNGDGVVDATDISILLDHWGQNASSCDIGPKPLGDRVVSDEDLEVLYQYVDGDLAVAPTPALNETDVAPFVNLNWTRGAFAQTYDVYFGTSFDDVRNASRADPLGVLISQNQTANTYDIEGALELGQTYHWRVDEVNALSEPSIVKGVVWSFTTESAAGPIVNIVATASSAEKGAGPEHTIDGSGLDADSLHSTDRTTMWLSAADGPQPTWIQYEFDAVYPLDAMWVWDYNGQFEQFLGMGFKDVTVEYSQDGVSWSTLGGVEFAQGSSQSDYGYNTVVEFGGAAAKYVRLTARSNWGGLSPQYGLSEVRFFYVPPAVQEAEATDD